MPVVSSRSPPPVLLLLVLSSCRIGIEMAAADTTPLGPMFAARSRLGGVATGAVARCAVAVDAQQMRHSLPVGEALELATVPQDVATSAGDLLVSRHGVRTALDLQLVAAGGAEAEELLGHLKDWGLSVGDRAKVRLLLGPPQWAEGKAVVECRDFDDGNGAAVARGLHMAPQQRRVLQDNGGGGLSMDTIAIVLSVLVGAAGYVVQAFTARRAERLATIRAEEHHIATQNRQREHEQMLSQIRRVDRWLDECCRPIEHALYTSMHARQEFVGQAVAMAEEDHPELIEIMLPHTQQYHVRDDGCVVSRRRGAVAWEPAHAGQVHPVCGTWNVPGQGHPTAAGTRIAKTEAFLTIGAAFCREMPTKLLELIEQEPTCHLAQAYRRYIRNVHLSCVRKVANILHEQGASMEYPPRKWLDEIFDQGTTETYARSYPNFIFAVKWASYFLAFENVVRCWDEDDFKTAAPISEYPFGGLFQTVTWSRERAEKKELELVGMTAAAKVNFAEWALRAKT
eukprot:SAG31_NODE_1965_length_6790_cov_70.718577_1_plen_512_part_00